MVVTKADFFVGLRLGDYGPGVGLSTCSCCRGDSDNGKSPAFYGKALSAAAMDIMPILSGVGSHNGYALCRVNGASAAQPYYEVAIVFFGRCGAFSNVFGNWVGNDLVKHGRFHAVFF